MSTAPGCTLGGCDTLGACGVFDACGGFGASDASEDVGEVVGEVGAEDEGRYRFASRLRSRVVVCGSRKRTRSD